MREFAIMIRIGAYQSINQSHSSFLTSVRKTQNICYSNDFCTNPLSYATSSIVHIVFAAHICFKLALQMRVLTTDAHSFHLLQFLRHSAKICSADLTFLLKVRRESRQKKQRRPLLSPTFRVPRLPPSPPFRLHFPSPPFPFLPSCPLSGCLPFSLPVRLFPPLPFFPPVPFRPLPPAHT